MGDEVLKGIETYRRLYNLKFDGALFKHNERAQGRKKGREIEK